MSTKKNSNKRHKPKTMHDVARLAGVSQATVSRVLNNSDTSISISEETRTKVLAAVEELGYRPNMHARSLRSQKTQMIAVLIADLSNGYYHAIVHAIQAVARVHKYDVIIASSDHLYENEKQFFEAMTRRPVDGIIMRAVHLSAEYLDQFIAQTNTPLAVLGYQIDHPHIDTVFSNDQQAVYDATRWLIEERGFAELGFIGVPDNIPPGRLRFQGFKSALEELNVPLRPEYIVTGDFTLESGKRAAQQLISQGSVP